jgi:hypothetical protein
MSKKLGDGGGTRFWLDNWVGPKPLCELFPRLFSVSTQPEKFIKEMGEGRNDGWVWRLTWRRRFFAWEDELLVQLMELINQVNFSSFQDKWVCGIGVDRDYVVKDGYCFLSNNFLPRLVSSGDVGRLVKKVWESFAPMKVIIFSWQLMLQRLPTRANLLRRGVIRSPSHAQCVWCGIDLESEDHLFSKCCIAVEVWAAVHSWLGVCTAAPGNTRQSFESFGFPFKCKKTAKGINLIWQAVIWSLWLARNSTIFEGKLPKVYDIVEAIKHRSLEWFIASKYAGVCLFYEWEKLPLLCILR